MSKLIELRFFQSRVARRLMLLFIICAIAPVGVLAYLSYQQVVTHLKTQTQQYLHQASKTLGISIFERLSHLDIELKKIATNLSFTQESNTLPYNEYLTHSGDFLAMAVYHEQSSQAFDIKPTFGNISKQFSLSSADKIHLSVDKSMIITLIDDQGAAIYMLTSVNNTSFRSSYLVVKLNIAKIFQIESVLPKGTQACIFGMSNIKIYCTFELIHIIQDILPNNITNSASALYNLQHHIGYRWDMFMKGAFNTGKWGIILVKPKQNAFQPLDNFKHIFPLIIIVSILLVSLLSSYQIRRYLVPLEKLKKGTNDIASGKLESRVELTSNDEFSDLSESFNSMANKLDQQFNSLKIMAEVDRLILSSLDHQYVVETVLVKMKSFLVCDFVKFSILEDGSSENSINFHKGKDNRNDNLIQIKKVVLDQFETTLLNAHPQYLLVQSNNNMPSFLENQVADRYKTYIVFPIFIQTQLSAFISMAYCKSKSLDELDISRSRDLVDRIAVALSNATWEQKLYHQANFDTLTQLPNRSSLNQYLEQSIQRAKRDNAKIAVLLFNIDRFKSINDSLGYESGDNLIREFASRIKQCITETVYFGRFNGDKFTLVISDINTTDRGVKTNTVNKILLVLEQLFLAIKPPFKLSSQEVTLTISMGISLYPNDATSQEELFRCSEVAMYHAKSPGANSNQFYSKDLNAISASQLKLENELRRAIENDELELYYQPQFDALNTTIIGAEALIRWNHSQQGILSPAVFVPLANETGLILPLSDWVLNKACSQIQKWTQQGLEFHRVAVNLSAHQLIYPDFVIRISEVLQKYAISPQNIELEITEDALVADLESSIKILLELKKLNIKLAIDDFGTGYSSLSYLANFPIDVLKIDKIFIEKCLVDQNTKAIIESIIALARSLQLKVVAEGVETKQQYDYLVSRNCDIIQGYYFSPPVSALDFTRMLTSPPKQLSKHSNS